MNGELTEVSIAVNNGFAHLPAPKVKVDRQLVNQYFTKRRNLADLLSVKLLAFDTVLNSI